MTKKYVINVDLMEHCDHIETFSLAVCDNDKTAKKIMMYYANKTAEHLKNIYKGRDVVVDDFSEHVVTVFADVSVTKYVQYTFSWTDVPDYSRPKKKNKLLDWMLKLTCHK